MALFLPAKCWLVTTKSGTWQSDRPWPTDRERYGLNLLEEDNGEDFFSGEMNVGPLRKDPRIASVEEVWVITSEDPVRWPDEPRARLESCCMGSSLIYADHETALEDLAQTSEPVRELLALRRSGPEVACPLAAEVLDGKLPMLHVLGDALEEANHPRTAMIRHLARGVPRPSGGPGAKGKTKRKKSAAVAAPQPEPGRPGPSPGELRPPQLWQPPPVQPVAPAQDGCAVVLRGGPPFRSVSVTRDGSRALWVGQGPHLHLHDLTRSEVTSALLGGASAGAGAISPDGRLVACGTATNLEFDEVMNGQIHLWQTDRMILGAQMLATNGHNGNIYCLAFAPDGGYFALTFARGVVGIGETKQGHLTRHLYGHRGKVWSVAWSPDGERLASAGEDGTVRLWDSAAASEIRSPLLQVDAHASAVDFSPDGEFLAAASFDGAIRLWPADGNGKEVLCIRTPSPQQCLSFSADGKRIASGGRDNAVYVWDVASGELVRTLAGHAEPVHCVAFLRDGRLASGGADGTARLWDADQPPSKPARRRRKQT